MKRRTTLIHGEEEEEEDAEEEEKDKETSEMGKMVIKRWNNDELRKEKVRHGPLT